MKRAVAIGVLLIIFIGLIGYFQFNLFKYKNTRSSQNDKIQITTSFYPLYYFATQIVGDKATVYNITPGGAEPHDYEPTIKDVARIEDSQLLILNGDKLEVWGERMFNTLQGTKTKVITVGENLTTQNLVEENNTTHDPHVWLNIELAKQEALTIEQSIEQLDPKNALYYLSNLQILNTNLDNLNQEYVRGLSSCQRKDIITAHSAFGYLAREYNFNQISISGLSPDEEPSPQKLVEISDFARKNKIEYIFFESLVSPKLSQTIANEIGAKTLVLNPIEGMTESEISQGKNYFTEMKNNLTNLRIALQCQ